MDLVPVPATFSAATIALLEAVSVANIDSPTELNAIAGIVVGERRVCYQAITGDNVYTVYYFDASDTSGASTPYVMAASGSGFWIAGGGKYTNSAVKLRSTLDVAGVITSSLATGTAPFSIASTTVVPNLNASLLGGNAAAAFLLQSVATTKGDIVAATGSGALTRLGVGSNTFVLTADSTQATGIKWAAPASTFDPASPGPIGGTTPGTGKFTSLTDTGLTATRVPFSGTGGLLSDSADMTFASGTGALTLGNASATHIVSSATDATSSTAASVQLSGGLAVAKAAWIGSYVGLTSAASPSLVNGQMWNDSTQGCFQTYQQSLKQSMPGCVLATGDIQTITNTTTETSMSTPGSRFGTSTFPANFFKAGKHIRIDLTGFYNSLATPGTLTIRVKIGGTTRATLVISDLKASGSIVPWQATVVYFCQATGSSGNFDSGGTIIYTGSGGTSLGSLSTGGGTTVDTTVSQVIELTAQWATASTSNTWTTTSAIYTIFN